MLRLWLPALRGFLRLDLCNAPMGGVRPDVGEGVRLLGKSMGAMAGLRQPGGSLVLRWTSKLGYCLTRQSKRLCSEAVREKAISDKPSTWTTYKGFHRGTMSRDERDEWGSLRRDCDTLT